MRWHKVREQILIVALAGMQAAQCPEAAEMKWCEDTSVAKIGVRQNLR
jgi:hypothetical protein